MTADGPQRRLLEVCVDPERDLPERAKTDHIQSIGKLSSLADDITATSTPNESVRTDRLHLVGSAALRIQPRPSQSV